MFLISLPRSEGCLTPVLRGQNPVELRLTDTDTVPAGFAHVSSLQSGQLTTMTNQCEGIGDSLRLPEEKITGNNWDGTTCGSLWGVESNPLCPELWVPEADWNWWSGMVSALNKIIKQFTGPLVFPSWGHKESKCQEIWVTVKIMVLEMNRYIGPNSSGE